MSGLWDTHGDSIDDLRIIRLKFGDEIDSVHPSPGAIVVLVFEAPHHSFLQPEDDECSNGKFS